MQAPRAASTPAPTSANTTNARAATSASAPKTVEKVAPVAVPAESADPNKPVHTPEILSLRAKARAAVLKGLSLSSERPVPSAPQAEGSKGETDTFLAIENEPSLEHFHDALRRLVAGKDPDGKVRIAAYGASHTQADVYTGYLRRYLQSRFGNGGPGFMQMARFNEWYRRTDYHVWSRGMQGKHAQSRDAPRDGRFGLMGVAAFASGAGDYGRVKPRDETDLEQQADRYELFYSAEPRGTDLLFSLNWKPERLAGLARSPQARYRLIVADKLGWHQAQVAPVASRGRRPIRVYGMSVERSTPGVVLDTLGIVGTRMANMLRWDKALWHEHLKRRAPDLVTLAYGSNESVDVKQPIEEYEKNLRKVLTSLKEALPDASCLLIGPGDYPRKRHGKWQTRARLVEVIAAQRRVAPDFGCGFWDLFAFMGGDGAMVKWMEASPALGASDHLHFTSQGYIKMGMALGDALMRRYDASSSDTVQEPTQWGY